VEEQLTLLGKMFSKGKGKGEKASLDDLIKNAIEKLENGCCPRCGKLLVNESLLTFCDSENCSFKLEATNVFSVIKKAKEDLKNN